MANKYIYHNAAINGDGTLPDVATEAGGPGAWNDINILEGTTPAYGTLLPGDTVFIRSKTAADINIARSVNTATVVLGKNTATAADPITWILDDGKIWPGVSGYLIYSCYSSYVLQIRDYNRLFSEKTNGIQVIEMSTTPSYKAYLGGNSIHLKGLLFDFSIAMTGGNGCMLNTLDGTSVLENISILSRARPEYLIRVPTWARLLMLNVDIYLIAYSSAPVIHALGYDLTIIGGSISGPGATTGVRLIGDTSSSSNIRIIGMSYPYQMSLHGNTISDYSRRIHATAPDGLLGSRVMEIWGDCESRSDGYYPTLNATLPNSVSTKWSWWLYPKNTSARDIASLPLIKLIAEDMTTPTVTLELLVASTFSAANMSNTWLTVSYKDSNGVYRSLSTKRASPTDLESSSAPWSATTYGSTLYNKRKLTLSLPANISKDSTVVAGFHTNARSASANDTIILCPDFIVS
jgi:hypothetical protein